LLRLDLDAAPAPGCGHGAAVVRDAIGGAGWAGLAGLWVADYAGHGPEVVRISLGPPLEAAGPPLGGLRRLAEPGAGTHDPLGRHDPDPCRRAPPEVRRRLLKFPHI
jgi:hypothetical protein